MESLVVNKGFWKNKKVFVSGHTGFKGSWLSMWLRFLGADVVGYSLPPSTAPSLFVSAGLDDLISSVTADVRDLKSLTEAIGDNAPDVVFHLAAQPIVRRSYVDPVDTFSTNVLGTVNMLEACRKSTSVKAILVVTSDKCYRDVENGQACREDGAMGGDDPYSASKGCAEIVTQAYCRSFFARERVGVASVRAGNIIGGGDWGEDRLVPDFVRALCSPVKLMNVRNPSSVRPWQYVLDALSGYITLVEHLWDAPDGFSGGWNFGPDNNSVWDVSRVADELVKLVAGNARWEASESHSDPTEVGALLLDCAKSQKLLGWRPMLSMHDVLAITMEWYKNFLDGSDMCEYTQSQIDDYMRMLSK